MKKRNKTARKFEKIAKKLHKICRQVNMVERKIEGGYKDRRYLKDCAQNVEQIISDRPRHPG